MKKIDYNILAPVIDKLYEKRFPDGTPEKDIADYCEAIAQTIENAGWTTDDYIREYLSHGLKDLTPNRNFN